MPEEDLLTRAKKWFKEAVESEQEMREEMIEDLEFSYAINQWDKDAQHERDLTGRPCLTMDRLGDSIRKDLGSIRQQRPSIKVLPVEGDDQEVAEIYTDLIREIEYSSGNHSVYMTGIGFQLRMGYGVWEVDAVDNDNDVWAQDLRLRRCSNPFRWYFDAMSDDLCKRDGRYAFKSRWMSKDMFNDEWPDAEVVSFEDNTSGEDDELWWTDDGVRVVRAYMREPVERTVTILTDGRTVDIEKMSDAELDELEFKGIVPQEKDGKPVERKVRGFKVIRFNMTGKEILDGPQDWPGQFIPAVPVYGEEINLEGKKSYRGKIRTAKDPQKLYNYTRTTQAEVIMEQPRAPWVLGMQQVNSELKKLFWNVQNVARKPFLLFDDSKNPTSPQRVAPPLASQGLTQEAVIASDDIQRATGVFDPTLGAPSNETSGIAVQRRTDNQDIGNTVFSDNAAAAIEHTGRILVDLIPTYYDTQRVIRLRGEDDAQRSVEINRPILTPEGPTVENDLTRNKYDVRVAVGPSYKNRQIESAQSMLDFLQVAPEARPVVLDLVAKNQNWPGADEFAERIRKTLPPGLIEEEDPERQAALKQQAQAQAQQIQEQQELDNAAARGKTLRDIADAEKTAEETYALELENATKELELAAADGQIDQAVLARITALLANGQQRGINV